MERRRRSGENLLHQLCRRANDSKEREREKKIRHSSSLFTAGYFLREMVGMRQYEKKDKWLFVTLSQSLSNSKHGCASQISTVIIKAE